MINYKMISDFDNRKRSMENPRDLPYITRGSENDWRRSNVKDLIGTINNIEGFHLKFLEVMDMSEVKAPYDEILFKFITIFPLREVLEKVLCLAPENGDKINIADLQDSPDKKSYTIHRESSTEVEFYVRSSMMHDFLEKLTKMIHKYFANDVRLKRYYRYSSNTDMRKSIKSNDDISTYMPNDPMFDVEKILTIMEKSIANDIYQVMYPVYRFNSHQDLNDDYPFIRLVQCIEEWFVTRGFTFSQHPFVTIIDNHAPFIGGYNLLIKASRYRGN